MFGFGRQLLQPSPCLLGFTHGLGAHRAARGKELRVKREGFFDHQLFAKLGDGFGKLLQFGNGGRGAGAVVFVLSVIEQAPCASGRHLERSNQRLAVVILKADAAAVEAVEAVGTGDGLVLSGFPSPLKGGGLNKFAGG